jgi:hypothetical protein
VTLPVIVAPDASEEINPIAQYKPRIVHILSRCMSPPAMDAKSLMLPSSNAAEAIKDAEQLSMKILQCISVRALSRSVKTCYVSRQ